MNRSVSLSNIRVNIKISKGEDIMNRLMVLTLVTIITIGFSSTGVAQEVTIEIKGSSWDADSRGFASIGGLSEKQRTQTAARRGSRVSVDGHPDIFAIAGKDGKFELTFTTDQPTFRLIVEGDRFPRTITQPFVTLEESGEIGVGRVKSPRAEGPEHTWPLPMVAAALGYVSTHEMLANNKAAIRFGIEGSGSEGAPDFTSGAKITFPSSDGDVSKVESTTTSPFLMRVQKSEYLIPFLPFKSIRISLFDWTSSFDSNVGRKYHLSCKPP